MKRPRGTGIAWKRIGKPREKISNRDRKATVASFRIREEGHTTTTTPRTVSQFLEGRKFHV